MKRSIVWFIIIAGLIGIGAFALSRWFLKPATTPADTSAPAEVMPETVPADSLEG